MIPGRSFETSDALPSQPFAGFLKLNRSSDTLELLRDHKAFALLALIAYRARRNGGFSVHALQTGEALIGDYQTCGLTEQQYRSAKDRLIRWGFITCRATNKGTVARIINTRVFDINTDQNNGPSNDPATTQQRPNNDKQEGKDLKKGEDPPTEHRRDKSLSKKYSGPDYSKVELREVRDYGDIQRIPDPIIAAISVTAEQSKKSWGYWVKILNQARRAQHERADQIFRDCLAELWGEMRQGEVKKPGAIFNRKLKAAFDVGGRP